MAWCRLHESILDNPKLLRAPRALVGEWAFMLAVASRHGGRLPDWPDLAIALRRSEKECRKVVDSLREAKLIDEIDGVLIPHDWNEHQYKSDSSTERVRNHRKRQKERPKERSKERGETVSRNAPEQSRADDHAPSGHDQSAPAERSSPVAQLAPAPDGARAGATEPWPIDGAVNTWSIRLRGHRLGETQWPTEWGAAPEDEEDNDRLDGHQRRSWRRHFGLPAEWRKAAA